MNEIQFILYSLPDEEGKVQVVIKDETMWATQKAMAQLFGVGVPAVSKHLSHIFDEGELDKEVVVSKMEITTQHGAIEGKTQSKDYRRPYKGAYGIADMEELSRRSHTVIRHKGGKELPSRERDTSTGTCGHGILRLYRRPDRT